MQLSHRDHRVDRSLFTGFLALLALVVGGAVAATVVPWAAVGLGLVVLLGVAGAVYVVRADRRLREYVEDVRTVHEGGPVDGWVRYEVGQKVPRERPVGQPTGRSPHTRPAGGSSGTRP